MQYWNRNTIDWDDRPGFGLVEFGPSGFDQKLCLGGVFVNPPLSFLNNLRLKLMGDIFFVLELVDLEVVVHENFFVNINKWEMIMSETRDPSGNSLSKLGRRW